MTVKLCWRSYSIPSREEALCSGSPGVRQAGHGVASGRGDFSGETNDDAVGRALDRIFEVGTGKVLSAVALRAVKLFDLDITHVHHDTTSHSVYGDYDLYGEESRDQPFVITFGFSKDHRPDLKQLVHSLLCVDAGIPIFSQCENGNLSDKVVNRNLIPTMVERMAELGQDNFLYVADSALITPDNLALMDDWKSGFRFVSRLPASYKECGKAIAKAVRQDSWHDLGILSEEPSTPKRKPAHYHGFETLVDLHGVWYRALVIHSDAYDERRVKKLERTLEKDRVEMERVASEQEKIDTPVLPMHRLPSYGSPRGGSMSWSARWKKNPSMQPADPKPTEHERSNALPTGSRSASGPGSKPSLAPGKRRDASCSSRTSLKNPPEDSAQRSFSEPITTNIP